MEPIPSNVLDQFNAVLEQKKVPVAAHNDYRKWVRYFLDFCVKHTPPDSRSEQVRLFIEKLRSKDQAAVQLAQASHAVSILFSLQKGGRSLSWTPYAHTLPATSSQKNASHANMPLPVNGKNMVCEPPASAMPDPPRMKSGKRYDEWRCLRRSESPSWARS